MPETTTPSAAQWRPVETGLLYGVTIVGFAGLLVAWWGVSGTAKLGHQVPWINVAAIALVLLGTGNSLWLMSGRRAVADRRRQLLGAFEHVAAADPSAALNGAGPQPVWSTGMRRYHRPTCQLVRGKATEPASVAAHERAGRLPCGMCQP